MKHLPYLQMLSMLQSWTCQWKTLCNLSELSTVPLFICYKTDQKTCIFFPSHNTPRKEGNHCTCASEYNFLIIAFKLCDRMSIKIARMIGFPNIWNFHRFHEVRHLVKEEKNHQQKSCILYLLVFMLHYLLKLCIVDELLDSQTSSNSQCRHNLDSEM